MFLTPPLKAKVNFSDHCQLSVNLDGCPSVHLSVNFSHFLLLLQNFWVNFNQTWHKVLIGKRGSIFANEGLHPFFQGEKNVKYKITFFSGPLSQYQLNSTQNILWVNKILVCSNEGPCFFPMGDNDLIENITCNIQKSSPDQQDQFQPNFKKFILG